jgi:FKBP-type peptidyl-prolyl cis-trans isomerase
MIPTQRSRRTAAALALSAAVLLTAACGSDESGESDPSDSSAASGPVATVSGQPGERPEITIDQDAGVGEETISRVITRGDGANVADGALLRLDVLARTVEGEVELLNSWAGEQSGQGGEGEGQDSQDGQEGEGGEDGGDAAARPCQQFASRAGMEDFLPQAVTEPLVGKPVGSRVQVEGRALELFGEAVAQQSGFSETEGVVFVIDVVGALDVDPRAEAEGEQAEAEEGMPQVEAGGQEAATITIPEGQEPPSELQEQVLIEGEGPEVEACDPLAVQYTGVIWANGEKFDSSWDRDSAFTFQLGAGQVVPGWDEGLVGTHVGDRVLLVLPPDMGYGDQELEGLPAGSTLVFVVDILGVA